MSHLENALIANLPELRSPRNTAANTAKAPLRFGVLGAADINQNAIISPCKALPEDAVIAALAARDRARAEEHVAEKGLEGCEVFDGYQELLDNADVDAIYVPSPNGLHYEWTMKALDAGYHVLCEKPFASNSEEARLMIASAREKNLVLMEAVRTHAHAPTPVAQPPKGLRETASFFTPQNNPQS